MHGPFRHLFAAGLVLGLAATPLQAAEKAENAFEVRTGLHKDFTRLVLETAIPVPYKFAFPAADEIVVTLTGPAKTADLPAKGRGIIKAMALEPAPRGSRLVIKTRDIADIRRQFTILPKDGHGARIVIDLAAADTPPRPPVKPAKPSVEPTTRPALDLPAPHTDIIGGLKTAPDPVKSAKTGKRPTRDFEVAASNGASMLFDGGTAADRARPVELAQSGLSINDWLMREGVNPNVRTVPPGAPPPSTVNPPEPRPHSAQNTQDRIPGPAPLPTRGQPATAEPASAPPAYRPYRAAPAPAVINPTDPRYARPAAQSTRQAPAWAPPADDRARQETPADRYARQQQEQRDRTASDQPTLAVIGEQDREYFQQRKFYAGFGLGMGMFDYESDYRNTTLDEDLFHWKIVGGYRPTEFAAVEMSLGKIGGFDETFGNGNSAESQFYGLSVSGILGMPLGNDWLPFARIGMTYWWESADNSASITRNEETGTGAILGLGADYRFSDRISLRGEWELYILSDSAYNNVFSASVLYNF